MMVALHKMGRTTPAVRAEIAASAEPVAVLARRYGGLFVAGRGAASFMTDRTRPTGCRQP